MCLIEPKPKPLCQVRLTPACGGRGAWGRHGRSTAYASPADRDQWRKQLDEFRPLGRRQRIKQRLLRALRRRARTRAAPCGRSAAEWRRRWRAGPSSVRSWPRQEALISSIRRTISASVERSMPVISTKCGLACTPSLCSSAERSRNCCLVRSFEPVSCARSRRNLRAAFEKVQGRTRQIEAPISLALTLRHSPPRKTIGRRCLPLSRFGPALRRPSTIRSLDEKTRRPQAPSQQSLSRLRGAWQRKDSIAVLFFYMPASELIAWQIRIPHPIRVSCGVFRKETQQNVMSAAIAAHLLHKSENRCGIGRYAGDADTFVPPRHRTAQGVLDITGGLSGRA